MKRALRYITIFLIAIAVGLTITKVVTQSAEAEEQIEQIDAFIESHTRHSSTQLNKDFVEPETVKLSYKEWKDGRKLDTSMDDDNGVTRDDCDNGATCNDHCGYETEMSVWELGLQYGISELDTTRSLILISYEGYGDSPLSYYVACACWARCTDNYFGADNLYTAFGGMDPQYDLWMDELGWEDYAVDALRECYLNPMYITGCNGVDSPTEWIYAEWTDQGVIYVW